jgi:hypothetical protein
MPGRLDSIGAFGHAKAALMAQAPGAYSRAGRAERYVPGLTPVHFLNARWKALVS